MMNKSKIIRLLSLSLAAAGVMIVSGHFTEANGQARDPFAKPGWAREKPKTTGVGTGGKGSAKTEVVNAGAPPIEQRIAYYKQVRENAVANGRPVPRVTSVLTLNEMSVTGIFRTPRGYAAMVEATPIKLSYTIYPGEKFFDGQLVAVEENRLVFRKVTKMSNGKFVASVENKPLKAYSDREQIQGTAPADAQVASSAPQPAAPGVPPVAAAGPVVSYLDEMNSQPATAPADAPAKAGKRPVRVAKSNK
ncbi:MAG: hypothetical protein QUS14_15560 [Pyrinomonadaceae bacterium]|nr:hypothetical protein [Pyrinomonadaceae bacterium]